MHVIDARGMRVVHAGRSWPFPDVDPSSRNAVARLERNEAYITWMQPDVGTIDDQIPVIKIDGKGFYVLSLRCMKVVFRHVRLRKGFKNVERNECGQLKLKIPTCLMREKMRTQGRFNVLRKRMPDAPPPAAATARGMPNVTCKIQAFLVATVFPLADALGDGDGGCVDFVASEGDTLYNMVQLARSE